MSFPAYESYKESGVEWLGRVPSHWMVLPLKRRVRLITERAEERSQAVGLENVESWTGRLLVSDTEFEGEGVAFEPGDVLYGKLRPYLAKVHAVGFRGEAVGDFHVLRSEMGLDARFLTFFLLTREVVSELSSSTYGARMPRVGWEFMGTMPFIVPPPHEQRAIAAFLNEETAKIDALVEAQKRLIALLKEKRQAVISHAVTKGLDPSAPMKDSGVEWLGQVPAHWQLRRLKHLSPAITVGIVVNPSNYVSDEGLPFIYGGDIREGKIDWKNSRRIDPEISLTQAKTVLRTGDLLTVRVGAPGVTSVVPEECDGGNCASVMHIRRGRYSSDWLCFVMNSRPLRFQVEVVQYGAAQEQFNVSHAIDFVVPTPPASEAAMIGEALRTKTLVLDALSEAAEEAIALLQERRAALISAAVTGKIDVRGLVQTAEAA